MRGNAFAWTRVSVCLTLLVVLAGPVLAEKPQEPPLVIQVVVTDYDGCTLEMHDSSMCSD